jgi:hypothetical protein
VGRAYGGRSSACAGGAMPSERRLRKVDLPTSASPSTRMLTSGGSRAGSYMSCGVDFGRLRLDVSDA